MNTPPSRAGTRAQVVRTSRPPSAAVEPLEGRVLFAAGDIDTRFGERDNPGTARFVVQTAATQGDAANAVTVLPDGKILMVGVTGTKIGSVTQFGLVRVNPDGTPDTTFGADGAVALTFGGSEASAFSVLSDRDGKPVLVDGGVIVGGYANNVPDFVHFALAKFDAHGAPDKSFGDNGTGRALTFFNRQSHSYIDTLLLQPGTGGGEDHILAIGTAMRKLALARYSMDGVIDPSFGPDGSGTSTAPSAGICMGGAILPDGRIAVVGDALDGNILLELFGADGTPLLAVESPLLAKVNDVAVQADGKLLVAGPSVPSIDRLDADFAVARFNADLTPDLSFGGGDAVATLDGGELENDKARAIVVQDAGDGGAGSAAGFLVAGNTNVRTDADGRVVGSDFAVARFMPDGTPDTTFGGGDAVAAQRFRLAGNDLSDLQTVATANALAVQANGRVVVAGAVPDATLQPIGMGLRGVVSRFGMARFQGYGPPADTSQGPTVTISGRFFLDANKNGTDHGERGLANMVAYCDLNDNGRYDAGEPHAKSGADGRYTIEDVRTGEPYRVREVRGGFVRTSPAAGFYDVTLTDAQPSFAVADFGNVGKAADGRPKVNNDWAATAAATPVTIDVLENDTDERALDPATVAVAAGPAHGTAQANPADGRITYTPEAGFVGRDRFRYTVRDTAGHTSKAATVTVTVLAAGTTPVPPGVSFGGPLPTNAFAQGGPKAVIPVVVTNSTSQAVSGGMSVTLYLSDDGTLDDADAVLATVGKQLTLKAGVSKTVKVSVTSFPDVPAGTYHVLAKVTTADGAATVADAPSTIVVTVPAVPLAGALKSVVDRAAVVFAG